VKVAYWKPPEGTTRIRILPGQDPGSIDKDFYVAVIQHYNVNSESPTFPLTCPRTTSKNNDCPVCTKVDSLYKTRTEPDKALAGKMRGKERFFMGIIPLEGEQAGKILIWTAPVTVKNKLLSLFNDSDYGDITHPTEGHDIKITRFGTGFDTTYDCTPAPRKSAISDDPQELQVILSMQPDLYKFRIPGTAEDIRKFMSGEISMVTQNGYGETKNSNEPEEEFPQVINLPPVAQTTAPSPTPESVFADPPVVAPKATPEAPKRPKFDVSGIKAQVQGIGLKR
jgi:hypothetical protein